MDIQVASNFERLIYDVNDHGNAGKTNKIMQNIKKDKKYIIEEKRIKREFKKDFISETITEQELLSCIKKVYENHKIIIDPTHCRRFKSVLEKINLAGTNIVLSTAHPCKFPRSNKKSY